MYKTRVSLLVGVLVILAAIVALQGFKSSAAGESPNRIVAGIGDLRKIEAEQLAPFTVGMGDLRYTEAQQLIPLTVGMGDLRYAEAQLIPLTVGMGDLHLFEAQR